MKRQVFIALFCLSLVATACTKPADQAGSNPADTSKNTQTETPAPTPTPSPAPGNDASKPANPSGDAQATPPPVEAPKGAKEQPVVTQDQYKKIQMDMSFAEVEKIMGQMGKLVSETKEGEGTNVFHTYEYKLDDNSSVKVTFRNGKVSSMSG